MIEYFRETLPIPLQKNIMTLKKPPTTLNEWYEWAIKLQNNFVHMKSDIAKTQNWGGSAPPTLNKKSNEKGPWRFYFNVGKKDLNSMDIDVMLMKKQAALKVGAIRIQHLYIIYYVSAKTHKIFSLKSQKKEGWEGLGWLG